MTGETLWDQFVMIAGADAAVLAEATGDAARLRTLGQRAFRIGLSSLLLGAEDVGRLAIAIERAIDRAGDTVPAELPAAIATLRDALAQLATADRSGARVHDLPLDEHRRALEAGEPGAAAASRATDALPGAGEPPALAAP
ncbi:MAG TPA: hypothetical protein VF469_41460, partial [Kofleriaceae bacterium]